MGKIIGIDGSRIRSGGGKGYLAGILESADPRGYGIKKVHLWGYRALLQSIPDYPWLEKHAPLALEKSIIKQLYWQYYTLPKEAMKTGCDILFNADAGSICPHKPSVTTSLDMLSFEPGQMQQYGFSKARLRLLLLKYIQKKSLQRAKGAIFLTKYAQMVIQKTTGPLKNSIVVPLGMGNEFRRKPISNDGYLDKKSRIECLYVSNTAMYKHQWNVVRAIKILRDMGINVSLLLVGGGNGKAQILLNNEISISDPDGEYVKQLSFVEHSEIPRYLAKADLFIFASSCENMPVTLLEAMASGLPIACSERGPMPEILQDGGVYFDPKNPHSIAQAVESIITNPLLREHIAKRAKEISEVFSWERCAKETWTYFRDLLNN